MRLAGSAIWTFSLVSYIILLLSCTVILFFGISIVVPRILESGMEGALFIITPIPVQFAALSGYWLVGWYLFLVSAIALSFVWLFLSSTGATWNAMKRPIGDLRERLASKSTMIVIAQLFLAVLFFNAAFYFFLSLFGVSTNVPVIGDGDLGEILYVLANASVYEEVITRILFIGLPLLLITYGSGASIGLKKIPRYILGGGFGLNRLTTFLLLFSSLMFAFAHLGSWDVYKVLPTFIAGLAMGYLYLKKGIFASILLHFSFNYLTPLTELLKDNFTATLILGFMILVLALLGAFFFAYYTREVIRFFSSKAEVKPPEVEERKPYFLCPRCGGLEAKYSEGTFECVGCGFKT